MLNVAGFYTSFKKCNTTYASNISSSLLEFLHIILTVYESIKNKIAFLVNKLAGLFHIWHVI